MTPSPEFLLDRANVADLAAEVLGTPFSTITKRHAIEPDETVKLGDGRDSDVDHTSGG